MDPLLCYASVYCSNVKVPFEVFEGVVVQCVCARVYDVRVCMARQCGVFFWKLCKAAAGRRTCHWQRSTWTCVWGFAVAQSNTSSTLLRLASTLAWQEPEGNLKAATVQSVTKGGGGDGVDKIMGKG